ncbi:MAG: hypothetical protein KGP14_12370 [Betaproteobacteria bacterium]|nr:hypothetical protein [Betaproteobacteria bacterium]
MNFHKQRYLHDPENGIYGDCMRTAVACIMDLELDDVPHFLEGNPAGTEFNRRVNSFLASKGKQIFSVPFAADRLDILLDSLGHQNPDAIYMLSGESSRGVNHVVICRGGEVIHDPHPSNSGLIGPCSPDGYYWVEILTDKHEVPAL